jgi:hypothetical protein
MTDRVHVHGDYAVQAGSDLDKRFHMNRENDKPLVLHSFAYGCEWCGKTVTGDDTHPDRHDEDCKPKITAWLLARHLWWHRLTDEHHFDGGRNQGGWEA